MNSKRKTYGVYGFMEMIVSIPCGKAKVNIPFSGGAQTTYGITPATFVTEDPFKQTIIENSDMFKRGKITLVNEADGTGKYNTMPANTEVAPVEPSPIVEVAEAEQNDDELSPVEVADIDVARGYLVDNCGVTQSSLRSKKSVIECAKENGICFITPEGQLE